MTKENEYLLSLLKNPMEAFRPEDILMESVRELVKEEVKKRIRVALEQDPELRDELMSAVGELVEARVREMYAMVKIAKCGAELGIKIAPSELRQRMEKDIASLLEKEVSQVMERLD